MKNLEITARHRLVDTIKRWEMMLKNETNQEAKTIIKGTLDYLRKQLDALDKVDGEQADPTEQEWNKWQGHYGDSFTKEEAKMWKSGFMRGLRYKRVHNENL
jgi:RNA binding exosome subunit